jgi:hypothetical protein
VTSVPSSASDKKGVGILTALTCAVGVAALFALGQAVTFAWLSALPEHAPRLESLERMLWTYALLFCALVALEVKVVWMLVQRLREREPRAANGHHDL